MHITFSKFRQKYHLKVKRNYMTSQIIYDGDLRCTCKHIQSGTVIETDAPTDNKGKGERFSPTDTVCVALATCMITTMAIKYEEHNVNLKGTTLEVTKHMLSDPRRIGSIDVKFLFPENLNVSEKEKIILERIGNNCPVMKSIHPDIKVNVTYNWN